MGAEFVAHGIRFRGIGHAILASPTGRDARAETAPVAGSPQHGADHRRGLAMILAVGYRGQNRTHSDRKHGAGAPRNAGDPDRLFLGGYLVAGGPFRWRDRAKVSGTRRRKQRGDDPGIALTTDGNPSRSEPCKCMDEIFGGDSPARPCVINTKWIPLGNHGRQIIMSRCGLSWQSIRAITLKIHGVKFGNPSETGKA